MDAYGGFIFICETEKEVKNLRSSIARERSCSVVMDNDALTLGEVEICFFSYDGKYIEHATLMRRSIKVATAKYNLKFFRIIDIPSLAINEIEDSWFSPSPYLALKPHMLRSANDKESRQFLVENKTKHNHSRIFVLSAYIDLRWRLRVQRLMKPLMIVKREVRSQIAHCVCHALVIFDVHLLVFDTAP